MTSQGPNPAPLFFFFFGAVVTIALVGVVVADPALSWLRPVVFVGLLGAVIVMYIYRGRIFRL